MKHRQGVTVGDCLHRRSVMREAFQKGIDTDFILELWACDPVPTKILELAQQCDNVLWAIEDKDIRTRVAWQCMEQCRRWWERRHDRKSA